MPQCCDQCTAPLALQTETIVEHGGARTTLCRICARDIIDSIDALIDGGMVRFSAVGDDRCPNCLLLFEDEQPIRISIGPWRRHALCPTCADPILATTTLLISGEAASA